MCVKVENDEVGEETIEEKKPKDKQGSDNDKHAMFRWYCCHATSDSSSGTDQSWLCQEIMIHANLELLSCTQPHHTQANSHVFHHVDTQRSAAEGGWGITCFLIYRTDSLDFRCVASARNWAKAAVLRAATAHCQATEGSQKPRD
jgi:hypothetical protein